ncbi:MAG: hypothetical protein H6672_04810 [Anaerolineaceae bacterium]|nr:hypothetical protein [Anaerolineaceae bacterium]
MSQSQLERGVENLYGDTSVRDELTDDEARELLKWGETQIAQLAGQELDDAQFDEAFAHLRKLISRMNRFTGRRGELSADEQQVAMARIAESTAGLAAQSLTAQSAPTLSPEQVAAYLEKQPALDNVANIYALIDLVAPQPTAAAAAVEAETAETDSGTVDSALPPTEETVSGTTDSAMPPADEATSTEPPFSDRTSNDKSFLSE